MPRALIFRPRQVVAAPPPTEPQPNQQPGVVALAAQPVPPGHPFAGAVVARSGPAQPLTAQQMPGRPLVASAEEPHPDQLGGRTTIAPWGLQQPVFAPTRPVVARAEEPHPEPGRVAHDHGRRLDHLPSARPYVAARVGDLPPASGRAGVGTGGFGDPRRPARPLLAARECERPHPGSVVAGKPPPPDLTPQQLPGVVRIAVSEEPPPPFPGWCFARVRPLVPSERLRFMPLVARIEEPLPAAGSAIVWRLPFGPTPPARFVFTLARTEEQRPADGLIVRAGPAIEALVRQQVPGRVLIAFAESPRPERGRVAVLTGRLAGAAAPSIPNATPAKLFQRADAAVCSFKRTTNVNSLSYQTRTKTPDQVLAVVFDFTNFPEVVAGATISSAVISGPAGAALTGITAGTPSVLAAAAVIDSQSNTVAAGKGVRVALAGGGAGDDVIVQCAATLSTGSIATVQGKIAVRNVV